MARQLPAINARAVDSVLESLRRELRRGQRQLARDPRGAVESAVSQLLSLGRSRPPQESAADPDRRTYRIDDLAQISGVTVRNIRAYQERGLLPPPERSGRVAYFDDTHLARLKIIASMLARGYTSAHIAEMLSAWEAGRDLGDVLGLERALVGSGVEDRPVTMSPAEARELAGGAAELRKMARIGLVEIQRDQVRVLRPGLLRSFAEMREYGLGNDELIDLHQAITVHVEEITRLLVSRGLSLLGPRFLGEETPTSDQVGDLVVLLTRFRALALAAVGATLETSVDSTVEGLLGDYLAQYADLPGDQAG